MTVALKAAGRRSHHHSASVPSLNSITWWLERGEDLSGNIDLAQDVFRPWLSKRSVGHFVARREERDDRVGQFSCRGKALLGNEVGEVARGSRGSPPEPVVYLLFAQVVGRNALGPRAISAFAHAIA